MTTGSSEGGSAGGGAPGGGDLEYRGSALERGMARMEGKIDLLLDRHAATDARLASIEAKIDSKASSVDLAAVENRLESRIASCEARLESRIVSVEARLDTRASAVELAEVKGRVMSLPTTYQMITLVFGILGGAFLIIKFGLPHGP